MRHYASFARKSVCSGCGYVSFVFEKVFFMYGWKIKKKNFTNLRAHEDKVFVACIHKRDLRTPKKDQFTRKRAILTQPTTLSVLICVCMGLFCLWIRLFCVWIGLFCLLICVFCTWIRLFGMRKGLFCVKGLFCELWTENSAVFLYLVVLMCIKTRICILAAVW